MNSTPNDGCETHSSAIGVIDRDIKRVEDKADGNTTAIASHAERITRNEERIACLSKQKCGVHVKYEASCLLDGKVDKKDGHSLIPDECLRQICTNKGDISLLEQYIKGLQERNERLEEGLASKANIEKPKKFDIPYVSGVKHVDSVVESSYYKTQESIVHVHINCDKEDGSAFGNGSIVAQLPVGFRPAARVYGVAAFYSDKLEKDYASTCYMVVKDNGEIYFIRGEGNTAPNYRWGGYASFLAVQ